MFIIHMKLDAQLFPPLVTVATQVKLSILAWHTAVYIIIVVADLHLKLRHFCPWNVTWKHVSQTIEFAFRHVVISSALTC